MKSQSQDQEVLSSTIQTAYTFKTVKLLKSNLQLPSKQKCDQSASSHGRIAWKPKYTYCPVNPKVDDTDDLDIWCDDEQISTRCTSPETLADDTASKNEDNYTNSDQTFQLKNISRSSQKITKNEVKNHDHKKHLKFKLTQMVTNSTDATMKSIEDMPSTCRTRSPSILKDLSRKSASPSQSARRVRFSKMNQILLYRP